MQLEDCQVIKVMTKEKHGYTALQIGATNKKDKHVDKPRLVEYQKLGIPPKYRLVEFKVTPNAVLPVGLLNAFLKAGKFDQFYALG